MQKIGDKIYQIFTYNSISDLNMKMELSEKKGMKIEINEKKI